MIALESKVRVGKSKLRDQQVRWLGNLFVVPQAELPNDFLHLRIIGIRGSELKRFRLLEQHEVFDAHGSFSRVIKSRCEAGTRIVRIRPRHPRRQRWGGLWSEHVLLFVLFVFALSVLLGGRSRGLLHLSLGGSRGRHCLGLRLVYSETRNKCDPHHTQGKTGQSIHRFSSRGSFFSMVSMIRISARCVLSASVAKLNNSASCPAPAVSNRSFTMVNAPL